MYKIMLVEDESAVLQAMKSTIDWAALSFHAPVGCPDGQAAIDAMQAGFVPDAVITDICMPFVDGVGLAEYLAQHHPSTLVVMLTGYDDFTYAHKAIKLKIYDYVLKPITPKALTQLAGRLRDELDVRRVKNVDAFDSLARERFLCSLLTTQPDASTLEDGLRVHRLSFGAWTLVLAADLDLPSPVTAEESRTGELLRYGLCNILTELAQQTPEVLLCAPLKDFTCLILTGESREALYTAAQALAEKTAEACRALGQQATCGAGVPVQELHALHDSYLQAVNVLHYRFFYGHVPFLRSEDMVVEASSHMDYAALDKRFTDAIKQNSRADAQKVVCALCESLKAQKAPYDICLRYSQNLMLTLLDLMGEYLSREDLTQLEHAWEQADFFAAATLPQLQQLLLQVCGLAFDSVERAGEDSAALCVRKAEAYIREHYSDETLSLNTIKEEFAISVSYFSAIFKAHTGSTFVEYLTQLRIEKAKQLLQLTEKRTSEVALEVGFADPHYFSVTFKRMTGLTPRAYRAQERGEAL